MCIKCVCVSVCVFMVACFAPLFSQYNNDINVALFEPVSSAFPSFDVASVSACFGFHRAPNNMSTHNNAQYFLHAFVTPSMELWRFQTFLSHVSCPRSLA